MKWVSMVITLLALSLAGCHTDELKDGYQFGDATHMAANDLIKLEQARKAYCDAHADALARRAALAFIRMKYPLIPADGICS